jgi:hypothetical protein
MTTAPAPSINEDLLQELEQKAAPISSSDWFDAETAMSCTGICRDDAEFITAANPATILALVEYLRSQAERLEKAEKALKRIAMRAETFVIDDTPMKPSSVMVILGIACSALGDAAIAQEGADHE